MAALAVFVQIDRMRNRPADIRAKAYVQTPTGVKIEAEEMSLTNVSKDASGTFITFDSKDTTSPVTISGFTCPSVGVTPSGKAIMDVDLNNAGNYHLWLSMMGKGKANSIWVMLDGHYCVQAGGANMQTGQWQWVDFQNGDPSQKIPAPLIGTGHHTIALIADTSQTGIAVDRILMATDASCVPTGNGDACIGVVSVPTDTPTPTPTSVSNNATNVSSTSKPVITTDSLPDGTVGVAYDGTVVATSDIPSGTLGMTALRLPPGLSLPSCSQTSGFSGSTLTCPIVGTPEESGVYNPAFSVIDSSGTKVQKTIKIKVL